MFAAAAQDKLGTMLRPPFPFVVQSDGPDHIAWSPPTIFRRRGLAIACAAPVAVWGLIFLIWSRTYRPSAAFEAGLQTTGAIATALFVGAGLLLAACAGPLSRRTIVRFDRARRVVRRQRDGLEIAWTSVHQVRAHAGRLGTSAIDLVDASGAVHLRLASGLPSADPALPEAARQLQSLLEESSYRHGHAVTTGVDLSPPPPPLSAPTAAALCCIPLLGAHAFAPLYLRLVADTRPLVTHHAQQSARNLMFTLAAFLAIALLLGPPCILTEGTRHHPLALTVFLTASAILFLAYFTSSALAVLQALRSNPWRIPWLKLIWRRD
jgi:hypothetical protein